MRRKLSKDHAFVALGANLPGDAGDPADTLRSAMAALMPLSKQLLVISGIYESDPKDCPPGSPVYVNAVAALLPKDGEDPFSLLRKLQEIEYRFGRTRSGILNEARTLDLDLLAFDSFESDEPTLTLPHPRAHERRFVLEPWIEIAGEAWPLRNRTLGEWLFDCTDPPLRVLD